MTRLLPNGCDGERLAVGDLAVVLGAACGEHEVGADAARVHERHHGIAEARRTLVAASWASAMTSPRADSPAALAVRVMSAVIVPMTWLASGADSASYLSINAVTSASGVTPSCEIAPCC